MNRRAVVTGAFSYTGSAVAATLLERGWQVHTLTGRVAPMPTPISVAPLRFELEHLRRELSGAEVLISTFWIRLPVGALTFDAAVERASLLIRAAREAGVQRVVQVTVSNPERGLNLGYYAGKARVEAAVRASGMSYAIVRPTLVVGGEDVLTNNIAWLLRHVPVFILPEGGKARVQPITLEDNAKVIVDAIDAGEAFETDAAGPEVFTFSEYVRLLAAACGVRRLFVSAPNGVVNAALWCLERLVGDVVLTPEELLGLEQELLFSTQTPRGTTSVSAWIRDNGPRLGRRYVNDLHRHFGAGKGVSVRTP